MRAPIYIWTRVFCWELKHSRINMTTTSMNWVAYFSSVTREIISDVTFPASTNSSTAFFWRNLVCLSSGIFKHGGRKIRWGEATILSKKIPRTPKQTTSRSSLVRWEVGLLAWNNRLLWERIYVSSSVKDYFLSVERYLRESYNGFSELQGKKFKEVWGFFVILYSLSSAFVLRNSRTDLYKTNLFNLYQVYYS